MKIPSANVSAGSIVFTHLENDLANDLQLDLSKIFCNFVFAGQTWCANNLDFIVFRFPERSSSEDPQLMITENDGLVPDGENSQVRADIAGYRFPFSIVFYRFRFRAVSVSVFPRSFSAVGERNTPQRPGTTEVRLDKIIRRGSWSACR